MLSLRGVWRTWKLDAVEVPALRDVDLDVAAGEVVALTGPSGSGKSTLLHVAALLDPPSRGEVRLGDDVVSALGDDARSAVRLRRMGFVHQAYPMIGVLTPLQNVALPARWAGKDAARARALLDAVGLGALADRDVRTLSGGERQRVAIARALVNGPEVVFADEPTAALDSETGAMVLEVLMRVVRDAGVALVLASHDDRVAARADRVVRIENGRLA